MAGTIGHSGRKPDPDQTPQASGCPVKPTFDSPLAERFWDENVPELIELGVVGKVDTARLKHLCEVWALLQVAYMRVKDDPIDKDARIAYVAYSTEFTRLSAAYGMTAVDRRRVKADGAPTSSIPQRPRA